MAIMTRALLEKPAARVVLMLTCLYVPYAWLLLIPDPWDSYRWQWIRMWPILPGLLVMLVPSIHDLPHGIGFFMMGLATSALAAPITIVAARSKWPAIVVAIVVGLLSCANSWISYELFRF